MKKLVPIFLLLIFSISFVFAEDNQTDTSTETPIICSETQCDDACVVCDNSICHNIDYQCKTGLSIEKISPESIQLGLNQINILLKNTGETDLANVYAKLFGDGIETKEDIPIDKLPVGQKDYTFVKIDASKSGNIDLVVKLYIDDELLKQEIKSIFVIEEKQKPGETINTTELLDTLTKLKEDYKVVEKDYQTKKLAGVPVDVYKNDLDGANNNIKTAQVAFYQGDYKTAKINLDLASESITNLKESLSGAKAQEKSLSQKIKDNLMYVAGIAAAFVSILTAYRLSTNYVNKKKIMELHQKGKDRLLTFKQKGELKKLETKEKEKKEKKKLDKKITKKEIAEDEE